MSVEVSVTRRTSDESGSTWEIPLGESNLIARDIDQLYLLCDRATNDNEESWNAIREWIGMIRSEDEDETVLVEAADVLGENNTKSLHVACRNCPPADIVQTLIDIAPGTLLFEDSFGWIPLHYACSYGASEDVLRVMTDSHPDSNTVQDRRGRTALHFALGNIRCPPSPGAVEIIASSGAAACQDENGMIPLHYACAYGVSKDALLVLIRANPESITAADASGRTPLHFAMGNADKRTSPSIVEVLLSHNQDLVNITDDEGHPALYLLSTVAHSLSRDAKKQWSNTQKCLDHYLDARPTGTVELFLVLQNLPEPCRDRAVCCPNIQASLNTFSSKRFPTTVLMVDVYAITLVVVFFGVATNATITNFAKDDTEVERVKMVWYLVVLYCGGLYFLLREIIQMICLAGLRRFKTWIFDLENWLDVICIVIVFFWTTLMWIDADIPIEKEDHFRIGVAFSTMFLWMWVLSFLRQTRIDFAIFVGGLLFVVKRLTAFMFSLILILVAFAQMFFLIFLGTKDCQLVKGSSNSSDTTLLDCTEVLQLSNASDTTLLNCKEVPELAWCSFRTSFLKVTTMFLGEVDYNDFNDNTAALVLFVIFIMIATVLLANVLIAMVTDSYGVVKNDRAHIVFWTTRLDFVTEMRMVRSFQCTTCVDKHDALAQGADHDKNPDLELFGQDFWNQLIEIFDDHHLKFLMTEFWFVTFCRVISTFAIPFWLLIGFFPTAGLLWPPQVRNWIMVQTVEQRDESSTLAKQQSVQIKELKMDIHNLQKNSKMDMEKLERDIIKEIKQVKELMALLIDVNTQHT